MEKTKILIVDDHPAMRQGMTLVINREPDLEVCGEASNREETLALIRRVTPDLAIVDISLQDRRATGLELISDLRAQFANLPVLVMSMHDEELYAERALRAGARGYLMKHEPISEILVALRRIAGGEIYLSARMNQYFLQAHIEGRTGQSPRTGIDQLSKREFEVLQLLGKGLPPREIGKALNLSVKTVESHRLNMRKKLGCGTAAQLNQYAVNWMHSQREKV